MRHPRVKAEKGRKMTQAGVLIASLGYRGLQFYNVSVV